MKIIMSKYFALLALLHWFRLLNATVIVPHSVPQGASQHVDHAFAGLAMESLTWPQYTDKFSQNLYNALSWRTGVDLIIRIGGTSMDHTIYDLNQEKAVNGSLDPSLKSDTTLGTKWFDTFRQLDNVSFILQFGFARDGGHNYTEAVGYIQNVFNHTGGCKSPKFQAVELANEPNLYAGQGARSKDYSVEDYARQAAKFMDVLRENITCLGEGRKFQVFQKSSSTSDEAWSTENFMSKSKGIIDFKRVTSVAQHFYCTMDSTVLQETLLNHEFTVSRTNTFFKNASRLVQGKAGQGATFIIDEVGNANVNKTNYDKDALSKSLGSAVWTADWMLRINMQNGAEMAFAEWIPTRLQGGWYGHAFVADFIGKDAKNQLQVKELTSLSKNVGNKHMVGYAGYERGKLAKIALANLELWNGTESETERRPLANVSLGLDGVKDGTAVTARRLAGPNGTATSGLTWGGLDWPHSRGGVETSIKNDSVRFKVAGGKLDVSVNATEAMLLTW